MPDQGRAERPLRCGMGIGRDATGKTCCDKAAKRVQIHVSGY